MQRVASVSLSARLVDLLSAAVGEQQDDGTEVLLGRCPQQLLAQGKVDARQRRQKQTLLVLRPDPALPLLPDRQNSEMETLLEHGRLSVSSEEVHEHRQHPFSPMSTEGSAGFLDYQEVCAWEEDIMMISVGSTAGNS